MLSQPRTQFALVLLESLRMIHYVGSYGVIGHMTDALGIGISSMQAYLMLPFITGCMVGQSSVGLLSDRIGRRRTTMIFLGIYVLSCLATAFCHSPWLFMILRACAGLGSTVGEISVRTIIHENCDIKSGAKHYSRISGYSYILVGLAPLLLNQVSNLFGWQSFFIINGMIGITIFVITRTQLYRLAKIVRRKTATWHQLTDQLKRTIKNVQYQRNCFKYALVVTVLESGFFLFPVILTDHFGLSKTWLSILYGVITGIVGYLSGQMNTFLLKHFRITDVTSAMVITCCVLSFGYVATFGLMSGLAQFGCYLMIFYLSFLCSNIMIINLFVATTQSIEKDAVGSGLITSLTVSVYALASLIAGYFVTHLITSDPFEIALGFAVYMAVVLVVYFFIDYRRSISTAAVKTNI